MSGAIPPEVIERLKKFNDAVTALEDALKPHFDIGFEQHLQRPAKEMAKIDVMSLFTLNSLAWSLLATKGLDPKENDQIGAELKRTKNYVSRMKVVEDRKHGPVINQFAAKAFVRNAIYTVPDAATQLAKRRKIEAEREQLDQNAVKEEVEDEEDNDEDEEEDSEAYDSSTDQPSYSQPKNEL